MSDMQLLPRFGFSIPTGYRWLYEKNIISLLPDGPFQPWHYLPSEDSFDLSQRWQGGPYQGCLVAFAKRQDCDDLACFAVLEDSAKEVILVHGWTNNGYDVICKYDSFWDWVKAAIDDMAEWCGYEEPSI